MSESIDWSATINRELRTWMRDECCVFRRAKEEWGALGNMAGGFPLTAHNKKWSSSEALYQAERYPDRPDIQEEIRLANNGFAAKLVARKYVELTRPDWEESAQFTAMMWVLTEKFYQHRSVQLLLMNTDTRPIVEYSKKSSWWGAAPDGDYDRYRTLYGTNVLGQMWMLIRSGWRQHDGPSDPTLDLFLK